MATHATPSRTPPSCSDAAFPYKRAEFVASGVYGDVYRGIDTSKRGGNTPVALKYIPLSRTEGLPTDAVRELMSLQDLHHPNIVSLLHVACRGRFIVLVYEWCDCDLSAFVRFRYDDGVVPETDARHIMRQLCEALAHCHDRGVIHRDLKLDNVLVRRPMLQVKLADFGISRTYCAGQECTPSMCPPVFMAPELLWGTLAYTCAMDMWSLGILMLKLVSGRYLCMVPPSSWKARSGAITQWRAIQSVLGRATKDDVPDGIPLVAESMFLDKKEVDWGMLVPGLGEEGQRFLARLLTYRPDRRMTARAALSHPWLRTS